MNDRIPKPHHTVNEVMRRWPQTVSLFMHYGTACPGCPVGAFHTVEEAALEYRIPLGRFLSELRNVVIAGYKHPLAKRKSPAAEGRRSVRP
jgi:hybrid cluster-associated redox disulfide protein